MNDIDLLSFSAKAAGIGAEYDEKLGGMLITTTVIDPDDGLVFWNPLTDDGDAMRLACTLGIDVLHNWESVTAQWELGKFCREKCTDETRNQATRKAITRAAAEIGKAMP